MAKGNQFKPGQSGNPNGRPRGSRSKHIVAMEALARGEAEAVVKALLEKAKNGDAVAARPILDRIWPVRKGARHAFDLPEVTKAEDLPAAFAAVNRQVAEGELSPDEGALIGSLLEGHRKAIESNELAARIAALEERLSAK